MLLLPRGVMTTKGGDEDDAIGGRNVGWDLGGVGGGGGGTKAWPVTINIYLETSYNVLDSYVCMLFTWYRISFPLAISLL